MTIIVREGDLTVDAELSVVLQDRGYGWRSAIFDTRSREHLEQLVNRSMPLETAELAARDGDAKTRVRLREIQNERTTARRGR